MTECKLLFEFLENSNITELPVSLQDHLNSCTTCKEAWTHYCKMISYCSSFPKIEMSPMLYQRLANIPIRVKKNTVFITQERSRKYGSLIAVAASVLFVVTAYLIAITFDVPTIASHLPQKFNRIAHKAYSEVVKAYHSRNLLIGNIQYMSLPISMKVRELLPGMKENEQPLPKNNDIKNKEEKK